MAENELAAIKARLETVDAGVDRMDARFDGIDARLDRMDARFAGVDARFAGVDARFDGVDARFDRLETKLDETRHEMRLLHEDLVHRILALVPDPAEIERRFRRADDELRESIERRLEPLEAAERARRRPDASASSKP